MRHLKSSNGKTKEEDRLTWVAMITIIMVTIVLSLLMRLMVKVVVVSMMVMVMMMITYFDDEITYQRET